MVWSELGRAPCFPQHRITQTRFEKGKGKGRAPRILDYRLELAQAYEANGLNRNANREFLAAQRIDGSNDQAKAGVKRTR